MNYKLVIKNAICLIVLLIAILEAFTLNLWLHFYIFNDAEPSNLWQHLFVIVAYLISLACVVETCFYISKNISSKNLSSPLMSKQYKYLMLATLILDIVAIINLINYNNEVDFGYVLSWLEPLFRIPIKTAIVFLIWQTIRFIYYIFKRKIRHPIIPESRD